MKKLLLLSLLVAFASFASGQINYYEDFNDGLPSSWSIINNGSDTSWTYLSDAGVNYSGGVELDTYPNAADDWLISPQITVNAGDVLSFYSIGGYDQTYNDSVSVMISKAGTAVGDFTITLGGQNLTGASNFIKWDSVLTAHPNISAGDKIYVGIHCTTNGSFVAFDNFEVAQPGTNMIKSYAVNSTSIDVVFDDSLSSANSADYELIGSQAVNFTTATIDSDNKTILHLTDPAKKGAKIVDNVVDTLIHTTVPDSVMFYADITSISYTNVQNPDGNVDQEHIATYGGVVTATNNSNTLVVADSAGAYNGLLLSNINAADYTRGDSVVFYGVRGQLNDHTLIDYPVVIDSLASSGGEIQATEITAADIDTSIAANSNPAEQYENVLVTVKNVVIDSYDSQSGEFYATDGSNVIRIGDAPGLFEGTFDQSILQVGSTYDLTGIVAGINGEYQLVPREMNDLVMVDDNTPPVVNNTAQTVNNAYGESVNVQSNEASGHVYIVLDGEPQSTIAEIETAVSNDKASKAQVSAANTDISVSTYKLTPGDYFAYATDSAQNLSNKGTNLISVSDSADSTPPEITYSAQTVTNVSGDSVTVQSNEGGKVYIVLDGEPQSTVEELNTAVDNYKAAVADAFPGQDVKISTLDLKPGTYYGYAVDAAGNISSKGTNAITLNSGAYTLPFSENFDDSGLIPQDWKLVNGDGLVPSNSSWDALADSAWIVVNSNYFGSNVAMGVSYYSGDTSYANDWMITPKIKLTENPALMWKALSLTTSGDYPDDYKVYISTTDRDTATFMNNGAIYEVNGENWAEDADTPGDGIASHKVDLSNYANEEVYIAFRLMTPDPGGDRLAIDDIKVSEQDVTAPEITADAQTVTIGEDVYVQSSEPSGKVYIVLDGEPQSSPGELETAVNVGTAASAEVNEANTDIAISTTGLTAGTYYAYAVDSAKNMSNKSSNAITLEESGGTGIYDEYGNANISVFPNPVKDKLQFSTDVHVSRVTIYNTLGEKVIEKPVRDENMTINTSGLENGIYFINFENEKQQVKTVKFIKE
jgi:hypothetical protein